MPPSSSLLSLVLDNSGPNDLDLIHWFILRVCLDKPHALNNPHPTLDSAEDSMLPIQPWCWGQGDEELTAVGIGSAIGHAQNPSASVFEVSMNLVFELISIY